MHNSFHTYFPLTIYMFHVTSILNSTLSSSFTFNVIINKMKAMISV